MVLLISVHEQCVPLFWACHSSVMAEDKTEPSYSLHKPGNKGRRDWGLTSERSKHLEVISQSPNSSTLGPNPSLPATPQVFRAHTITCIVFTYIFIFYLLEGVHTWCGMSVEFRGLIKRISSHFMPRGPWELNLYCQAWQ